LFAVCSHDTMPVMEFVPKMPWEVLVGTGLPDRVELETA
jgi:hypothetical protein